MMSLLPGDDKAQARHLSLPASRKITNAEPDGVTRGEVVITALTSWRSNVIVFRDHS
jgi:hypothetical protein